MWKERPSCTDDEKTKMEAAAYGMEVESISGRLWRPKRSRSSLFRRSEAGDGLNPGRKIVLHRRLFSCRPLGSSRRRVTCRDEQRLCGPTRPVSSFPQIGQNGQSKSKHYSKSCWIGCRRQFPWDSVSSRSMWPAKRRIGGQRRGPADGRFLPDELGSV